MTRKGQAGKTGETPSRRQRLAKALKENIRKRKSAMRTPASEKNNNAAADRDAGPSEGER